MASAWPAATPFNLRTLPRDGLPLPEEAEQMVAGEMSWRPGLELEIESEKQRTGSHARRRMERGREVSRKRPVAASHA